MKNTEKAKNMNKINELARSEPASSSALAPAAAELVKDAAHDPEIVYVSSLASLKSRKTMLEGISRVSRLLKLPAGQKIPWTELDYAHTNAIRSALIASYRPATVQITLACIRGVLRTAWRLRQIDREHLERATTWPRLRARRLLAGRALTADERARLGAYCAAQPATYGAFLRGLFGALFGAGLRADELCRLETTSYLVGDRALRLLRKGDKEAILPLGAEEALALEAWIAVRRELRPRAPWLFVRVLKDERVLEDRPLTVKSLEHLCADVAMRAGIPRFSPHDTRRTFATGLLDAGIDLSTVQRLMSHDSPETTARYDMRQAHDDARARRTVTLWGTSDAAPPELEVPAALVEQINETPPASAPKLSPRERLRAARRARLKG